MPVTAAISLKTVLAVLIALGFVIVFIGIIKEQTRSRNLNRSLLRATRGDRKLAARLLDSAKRHAPGHSERWYKEKIIYELERDRAGSGRKIRLKCDPRRIVVNLWDTAVFLTCFSILRQMMGDVMGSRNRA